MRIAIITTIFKKKVQLKVVVRGQGHSADIYLNCPAQKKLKKELCEREKNKARRRRKKIAFKKRR